MRGAPAVLLAALAAGCAATTAAYFHDVRLAPGGVYELRAPSFSLYPHGGGRFRVTNRSEERILASSKDAAGALGSTEEIPPGQARLFSAKEGLFLRSASGAEVSVRFELTE